jgi:hypothetical protein
MFCLLPLVIPAVRSVNPEPEGGDPALFLYILCTGMGIIAVIGWLGFYRSSLRVNDEGLEQIHLFKRKFIAWTNVQSLEKKESGGYFVKGKDTTISISSVIPADWEELKEVIARRSTRANGWQKLENKSSGNG